MGLLTALGRLGRRKVPEISEHVPMPLRPPREVGPGGMTVRPREPMRQSHVGGSEDLMEAARMIRQEDWPLFMALVSGGMSAGAALEMMERRA